MIQSRVRMWRRRAHRYMFLAGVATGPLVLGLSFIKPYAMTVIDRAIVPCVLLAVFLSYRYYQFKEEFKEQLEE